MDLGVLANIGEAVGGIAVVISLVYLGYQIRSNTKTVRASNYNDLVSSSNEFNAAVIDTQTAAVWVKGLGDFRSLSEEDQTRFSGVISLLFNASQRAYHLHQKGLIDEEMWDSLAHTVDALLDNAGAQQWWEVNQHWFPVGFRSHTNAAQKVGDGAD